MIYLFYFFYFYFFVFCYFPLLEPCHSVLTLIGINVNDSLKRHWFWLSIFQLKRLSVRSIIGVILFRTVLRRLRYGGEFLSFQSRPKRSNSFALRYNNIVDGCLENRKKSFSRFGKKLQTNIYCYYVRHAFPSRSFDYRQWLISPESDHMRTMLRLIEHESLTFWTRFHYAASIK